MGHIWTIKLSGRAGWRVGWNLQSIRKLKPRREKEGVRSQCALRLPPVDVIICGLGFPTGRARKRGRTQLEAAAWKEPGSTDRVVDSLPVLKRPSASPACLPQSSHPLTHPLALPGAELSFLLGRGMAITVTPPATKAMTAIDSGGTLSVPRSPPSTFRIS